MDAPRDEITAARLRLARTAKGLTQREVARYMEVTKQCVSHWEAGRRQPDFEHLQRLATLYGIDWHALVDAKFSLQQAAALTPSTGAGTTVEQVLGFAKALGYEAHFDLDNGRPTGLTLRLPKS
jgi:transcriptional regulator with XRE-family HTH domain